MIRKEHAATPGAAPRGPPLPVLEQILGEVEVGEDAGREGQDALHSHDPPHPEKGKRLRQRDGNRGGLLLVGDGVNQPAQSPVLSLERAPAASHRIREDRPGIRGCRRGPGPLQQAPGPGPRHRRIAGVQIQEGKEQARDGKTVSLSDVSVGRPLEPEECQIFGKPIPALESAAEESIGLAEERLAPSLPGHLASNLIQGLDRAALP
jgi:hypothetical protein